MSRGQLGSRDRPLPTFMWVNEVTAQITYPAWKMDPPAPSPASLLSPNGGARPGCETADGAPTCPEGPPLVPAQTSSPLAPPAAACLRENGPRSPGRSPPGAGQGPAAVRSPPSLPHRGTWISPVPGPPPLCRLLAPPHQPMTSAFLPPQGTLLQRGLSYFYDLSTKVASFSPQQAICQAVCITHRTLHRVLRGFRPDTNHDLV
uniref:Uncharacterized protein n=1 Tax=Rousettus aegyptiacus TaxID=9407 RepID=A0A7J8HRG9_ROUAE|nr:hypothetical protein HJG63_011063 [Rousettus aegyptiacus]